MPDATAPSLPAVQLTELQGRGIVGLIIDLDNTLTPWNAPDLPASSQSWLAEAREMGFRLCLLSNNRAERLNRIVAQFGFAGGVANARKPFPAAFHQACALLGCRPLETAVIGDQLWTDVLGGNLIGAYTVLLRPLEEREFWGTRLMRLIERPWRQRAERTSTARLTHDGQDPA